MSRPNHVTRRARALLARPGAWLETAGPGYVLRLAPDRRARVHLTLDEAAFRELVAAPGLVAHPGGGWVLRRALSAGAAPEPGRPGYICGERLVMQPDGRLSPRPANLGESPLAWLARRRDADGRPFLTPAQFAAGERLRAEAETALRGPSTTMRWDALPRAGGGSAARVEPSDRALSAARRVEAALAACGVRRAMVEQICIHGTSLQLAERGLGLRQREGKRLLIAGLDLLARHYRIG
ncbi:MAG: DUF6456 domain-containing protein [Pseudomonadota bacterium]